MVREVLLACLPVVDGDISLMYDLSKDTFKNYKERVKKIALKSEDKLFNAAIECINLRVILMHLTQHYEGKTNSVIDAIKLLLAELDKSLDEFGLGRTKRMFEY